MTERDRLFEAAVGAARANERKKVWEEAAEMAANTSATGTEARFRLGELAARLRAKAGE